MPPDLQSVLEWWTQHHMRQQFTYKNLTITHQMDHFSCGMSTTLPPPLQQTSSKKSHGWKS